MAHRTFRYESLCLQATPPAGYYLLLALNLVSGVLYRPWFPHSFGQSSINEGNWSKKIVPSVPACCKKKYLPLSQTRYSLQDCIPSVTTLVHITANSFKFVKRVRQAWNQSTRANGRFMRKYVEHILLGINVKGVHCSGRSGPRCRSNPYISTRRWLKFR